MDKQIITQNNDSLINYQPDQIQLIKDTVCRGATDDELKLFLYTAKITQLDPLMKQIYAVKRWDSALKREAMTVQTGIDGYRLVAYRTGEYAGMDDTIFDSEDGDHPKWAKTTVYRFLNGQRVSFTATARWDEYKQTKKDGGLTTFWTKMPYAQLAKCSETLALRKAFPMELSGLRTEEEMNNDISEERTSVPTGNTDKADKTTNVLKQSLGIADTPKVEEKQEVMTPEIQPAKKEVKTQQKYESDLDLYTPF